MEGKSKQFSVNEICAILQKSREMGVTQLKVGTLTVSFLPPEPKTPEVATPTLEQIEAAKTYQNDVFIENERRIRQADLDQLRLSDPEMYEELQNRGELEHAGEESNGVNA